MNGKSQFLNSEFAQPQSLHNKNTFQTFLDTFLQDACCVDLKYINLIGSSSIQCPLSISSPLSLALRFCYLKGSPSTSCVLITAGLDSPCFCGHCLPIITSPSGTIAVVCLITMAGQRRVKHLWYMLPVFTHLETCQYFFIWFGIISLHFGWECG